MPFLRTAEIVSAADGGYPFDIPAIARMAGTGQVLRFQQGVTVFVGDNGSGKSTLLEALALHQGLNAEGGALGMQFETRADTVSSLHRHLRVLRAPRRPSDAFFLRAESFFNVATAIESYGSQKSYGGGSLHECSHGESFIDLIVHRFGPRSLYFLDEPEAALSVHGQLQLLVRMHDLVAEGCQFVLATHSPLLMAFPDAAIYRFDGDGIGRVEWSEIDTVRITADFLAHPTDFLHDLLTDE